MRQRYSKVERVFFSNFSQSYWDWLPPEIQVYIKKISASMYMKDITKDSRKLELHNKFYEHQALYNRWSDSGRKKGARIVYRMQKCREHCPNKIKGRHWNIDSHSHLIIEGHFIDLELMRKDNVFLGHSYSQAQSRMNHVQSFLWY